MLTRCKERLIIVTNRDFIHLPSVKETLLGEMCAFWEDSYGAKNTWLHYSKILDAPASGSSFQSLLARAGEKQTRVVANSSSIVGKEEKAVSPHATTSTALTNTLMLNHKMKD